MRKIGIIVIACCAFALCFALLGCSSPDYTKNFTGNYKLTEMDGGEDGGGVIDADTIALLGGEFTLTVNEDKTVEMNFNGEKESGTWTPKDATTMTMTWNEESESNLSGEVTGTLSGNTLKLADSTDDASMTYEKQ